MTVLASSIFFIVVLLPQVLHAATLTTPTPTTSLTSTTTLALPTTPYTGQALLTGTCSSVIFSTLHFWAEGSGQDILEVPLIGCSDERPDCCPSLHWPKWSSKTSSWTGSRHTATGSSESKTTQVASLSVSKGGAADSGGQATGIVSRLDASPLSICPNDFVNLSPVCCPTGYKLYPRALHGRVTPCYRSLATPISIPANILASISSALTATVTATATATTIVTATSTPIAQTTINIVINEVFAIGLPCAVGGSFSYHPGLSRSAKAGIAVAVVVFCVVGLLAWAWWYWCMRTRKGVGGPNQISMNVLGVGKGARTNYGGSGGGDDGDDAWSGLVQERGREKYSSGMGVMDRAMRPGGYQRISVEAGGRSLMEMDGRGLTEVEGRSFLGRR